MFIFLFLAVACFSFSEVSGQRCFDKANFDYFTCEQTCTPATSSLPLIGRCNRLARFGCELQSCDGGYECTGPGDREILTCANSRVRFQDGDPTKKTFKFRIDLNTPPLAGDYYFLIHARLKLNKFLPGIKESIAEFIRSVNGSRNVRFGVGIYRNEDMLDMGYKNLQSLTDSHEAVQRAVNDITTRNAKSGPDANLQAIIKASTQPFRAEARKIIFLLGDTPGHEPSKVGNSDALTRETIVKVLNDADISFVAINYRRQGLEGPTKSFGLSPVVQTGGQQASFIAKETGGLVVFRTNSVFDAFWRAKASTDRTFDLDSFTCAEFIEMVPGETSFPVTIKKGESAVVPLTLMLKEGLCTSFTCQYRIMEDGMELERFTIEVPTRGDDSSC